MSNNQKDKKPSESKLAKQAIAAIYKQDSNITPNIVTINLPQGIGYAAVTKDHIQCFKYDKTINDVTSISKNSLSEFSSVTVDHYALKTVFSFKGTVRPFTFIPQEKGKEIERFIQDNTSIEIERLQRKWYQKILGFRSGKKWKMVVAFLIYIMIIGTIGNMISGKDNKKDADNNTIQTASTEPEKQKDVEKERQDAIKQVQDEEKAKAEEEKKKQEKEAAAKPIEKKEVTLEDKVKKLTNKKFGEKKVESVKVNDNLGTEDPNDKIVLITTEAKENISANYTKKGMWIDTISILKDLKDENNISEIAFFYKYPLVDQYGNEKKDNVMKITLNRETLDKINYDNFLHDNLPKVANQYWEHPALSKK
ncbi:hypothetical protein [Bacillus pacificus]|uniref:hypothetical protein n=1 Tax=Bacillus pacificus TaxID=2026187 RepID=UPI000B264A6B|nr:hypothetical protein [Bacillus pacificus]MCC2351993.1 hypothetical protein [Bacillus pacificus]MCU5247340.1 hypothetical protein [Bacillus pacificus]MCU5467442.1 hypothetical protein [Bacillus pacificus]